ncbi:hypothetical protein NHX12_019104 [Muraenolepis orangiensis]|uniref:Uncharacterized protein n=1 Tax=Muraenolepis orangiensis TaxID=630683 RepID=A0A9Q0ET41_9TELE|nr:hypothetical protein NHX12_019104 [Muraenolepis orangiensis]
MKDEGEIRKRVRHRQMSASNGMGSVGVGWVGSFKVRLGSRGAGVLRGACGGRTGQGLVERRLMVRSLRRMAEAARH